jgi:hypothetical protein
MNPKKRIRYFYDQFICLKGGPKRIAMGMAIGIFVGVTPTMPFHSILVVICTFLLRQNFTTAYLGSWLVMNPLTMPLFYAVEYGLGRFVIGKNLPPIVFTDYSIVTIIQAGWSVGWPLLLGGLLMAPFFAVPAYFITYRVVIAIREKQKE